ncbi:hypothetical protein RJT34_05272 [Clitoria ternatea]|uniref:Uncharacterized protein n=1 Tax=Clitoria ternatea TaxID=43366 RepID=A0AAN9PSW8_CLITE
MAAVDDGNDIVNVCHYSSFESSLLPSRRLHLRHLRRSALYRRQIHCLRLLSYPCEASISESGATKEGKNCRDGCET